MQVYTKSKNKRLTKKIIKIWTLVLEKNHEYKPLFRATNKNGPLSLEEIAKLLSWHYILYSSKVYNNFRTDLQ